MHTFRHHHELGFIEIIVEGCWHEDRFDRFASEYRALIAQFGVTGEAPMTLYNYTGSAIQPQTVVAKMRALAQHPAMIKRKVAMYTDGVLARQQARRVAEGRDNMRVFGCRADAIAYLVDDDHAENVIAAE